MSGILEMCSANLQVFLVSWFLRATHEVFKLNFMFVYIEPTIHKKFK